MEGFSPDYLKLILSKIEDGFIFEKFVPTFLTGVLGYNFIPHGRIKDRGIDGLEYIYNKESNEKYLFQFSIEKNPLTKLMNTLKKLEDNGIQYEQLVYVTNQFFKDKDIIIDEAFEKYKKPVRIYDIDWFCSNINSSPACITSFRVFIESYLHDFNLPGKSYVVGDIIEDPRLFVFLRQQWDSSRKDLGLMKIFTDSLILFALGDTDPQKEKLKTKQEIFASIETYLKFNPKLLSHLVEKRLYKLLRAKKVQFHKKSNGYCLPYETRSLIQKENIDDASKHEQFKENVEKKLKTYLKDADVKVRDCAILIEEVLNRIFYEQGIEFADFVLKGESQDAVEKKLPDIISRAVENSSVVNKNKESVKGALLVTIRDIVYNGAPADKEFLRRLSNTYMMLFLIQCDPKLTMYFNSLASKLNIFVCTSIIIPALSEYYLEQINRRHWNLLKGAHDAGVKIIINEIILKELMDHFDRLIRIYKNDYEKNEDMYGTESSLIFIEEIMIRAYYYARLRGRVSSFKNFVENFIGTYDVNSPEAENSILIFLKDTFGIEYISDTSRGLHIDQGEEDRLFDRLKGQKRSEVKARVDAKLILTIYAIREKNNEKDDRGVFSYKTWWLSKDIMTHKTLCVILNKKIASCYIRPDFLYNYISLAPKRPEVDEAFKNMFPSLLGINISFDLPKDITASVHQQIREHKEKSPTMLKVALGNLAEGLISDHTQRTLEHVQHFLDKDSKTN